MTKIRFIPLLTLVLISYIYSQRQKPPSLQKIHKLVKEGKLPRLRLSGYIKHESFWDSRQIVAFGDGQTLLYPKQAIYDALCNDINKKGQYNSVAIETRIRLEAHGPDIKGANSHGVIEGDFFGKESIVNIIRMRHAFVELDWPQTSLIMGQTWHPIYVLNCFPDTISFNGGGPIEPYTRDPQIKIMYHRNHMKFIFAAASHIDQPNDGPDGFNTKYQRDAKIPNLNARVQGKPNKHILLGAGIDYQRIVPRLVTNKNIKAEESLNNFSAIAFSTLKWKPFIFSTKFIYAENLPCYGMTGGYAVKCINSTTDKRQYTNLRALAFWFDTAIKKRIEPGLFVGYLKNIGASSSIIQSTTDEYGNIENTIYGMGTDINHVFRISPRVRWYIKKLTIGVELEHTRAGYGTINDTGKVKNVNTVGNTRLLIAAFYNF